MFPFGSPLLRAKRSCAQERAGDGCDCEKGCGGFAGPAPTSEWILAGKASHVPAGKPQDHFDFE